jgi:hypothetical protein
MPPEFGCLKASVSGRTERATAGADLPHCGLYQTVSALQPAHRTFGFYCDLLIPGFCAACDLRLISIRLRDSRLHPAFIRRGMLGVCSSRRNLLS